MPDLLGDQKKCNVLENPSCDIIKSLAAFAQRRARAERMLSYYILLQLQLSLRSAKVRPGAYAEQPLIVRIPP